MVYFIKWQVRKHRHDTSHPPHQLFQRRGGSEESGRKTSPILREQRIMIERKTKQCLSVQLTENFPSAVKKYWESENGTILVLNVLALWNE